MRAPALFVFAKAPIAGAVKTRLQPEYTAAEAAEIAAILIRETLALAVANWDGPIYLATTPTTSHPLFAELADVRTALEAGTASLADVYRRHRLRVPLDGIAYVARWITPAPSPRRYDARFFAAAMPPGQQARADGWEAVDAGWWRPTAALSDWQASRIDLIEPTIASLELLARFGTVAEAMATLHAGVTVEGSAG